MSQGFDVIAGLGVGVSHTLFGHSIGQVLGKRHNQAVRVMVMICLPQHSESEGRPRSSNLTSQRAINAHSRYSSLALCLQISDDF